MSIQLPSDEQWNNTMQDFERRIRSLTITPDMDPGRIKYIQSELQKIYEDLRPIYGRVKARDAALQRLIYRVEAKGRTGSSESARRANGVMALESYRTEDGQTINLFDVEAKSREQKEQVETLLDIIERKKESIVTFLSLFKVEASL